MEVAKEAAKEFARATVVGLFKRFQGKKPDEVKQVDKDNVEVKVGQHKEMVNNYVFNLYGDSAIRAGLDKITSPLRKAEIERIAVKRGDKEEAVFEKSEAEYFEAEQFRLGLEEEATEGERDAVLTVTKLSFVEGTTWSFVEKGATLTGKIEDPEFWGKVHKYDLRFGEGDRLRVLLHWKVVQTQKKKIVPKNTILKVYEVLPRPKQMRLDGGKDDEILYRGSLRRKFRDDEVE